MQAFADHGEVEGDQVTTQVRRGAAGDGRPGQGRHRLRRRHRGPRARGRRQVRDVVGRARRDRPGQLERQATQDATSERDPRGRRPRAPPPTRSRAHVPPLVEDGFAGRLFAQDPTLWGPDAEEEAGQAARPGSACPHVSRRWSARSRRCAASSTRAGRRPRRAVRHGRLVAGPRGDLRDVRRRADRARLQQPRPGPRGAAPTASSAPSWWSPASPARPSRPTPSAGPTSRRSPTPASTRPAGSSSSPTPAARWTSSPARPATGWSTPTPTWAAATPR